MSSSLIARACLAGGALLTALAARLCCEALHPDLAAVVLVAGVLLIAKGVQR